MEWFSHRPSTMKKFIFAAAITVAAVSASAQTARVQPDAAPTTAPFHELTFTLGGYNYVEPGDTKISIHGVKFGGEYTGAFSLDQRHHWFAKANVRATTGSTDYDGWCAPWFITPDRSSPNGYFLDLGEYSPCDDSGNKDWYAEGRGLVGKDFVRHEWTISPEAGLGVRHLSNALDEIAGFRTDNYLYLPIGIAASTAVGSGVLSFNFEYDHLLHGWQKTLDSALGGGDLPATPTAPAFSIDAFDDLSFDQARGFGIRASAKYAFNRRWSLEPYWIYWSVDDSTNSDASVTFTVRGISAVEQFSAVEPTNWTNEVGVKFGVHFR
jgi:hypothetical protein